MIWKKIDLRKVLDQERNAIRRDAVKMIKRGIRKKTLLNFRGFILILLGIGGNYIKNKEQNQKIKNY